MKVSIQNNAESVKLNTKKAHMHFWESLKIYVPQEYKRVLGVLPGEEKQKSLHRRWSNNLKISGTLKMRQTYFLHG